MCVWSDQGCEGYSMLNCERVNECGVISRERI